MSRASHGLLHPIEEALPAVLMSRALSPWRTWPRTTFILPLASDTRAGGEEGRVGSSSFSFCPRACTPCNSRNSVAPGVTSAGLGPVHPVGPVVAPGCRLCYNRSGICSQARCRAFFASAGSPDAPPRRGLNRVAVSCPAMRIAQSQNATYPPLQPPRNMRQPATNRRLALLHPQRLWQAPQHLRQAPPRRRVAHPRPMRRTTTICSA